MLRAVAVRRPLQDRIRDPGPGVAGEGIGHGAAGGVDVAEFAILGLLRQPRQAGAPAGGIADVIAEVEQQRDAVEAVAVQARAREALAVAGLSAKLHEHVGGREPLELHAVLRELRVEHRLIDQRLVGEIPGVTVDLVEIADAGEEPAALELQSRRQGQGLEEGFFDADRVVASDRGGQVAVEVRVDVGRKVQLGFVEVEAAISRADGIARRNEAGDGVGGRIGGSLHVAPSEYHRNGRVERVGRIPGAGHGRARRCLHRHRCHLCRYRRCRGGLRLELREPLLECLHPGLVLGLHRLHLGAQLIDLGSKRRRAGQQQQCRDQATKRGRANLGIHPTPRSVVLKPPGAAAPGSSCQSYERIGGARDR